MPEIKVGDWIIIADNNRSYIYHILEIYNMVAYCNIYDFYENKFEGVNYDFCEDLVFLQKCGEKTTPLSETFLLLYDEKYNG